MVLKPRTARFGVPSRNQEYFANVVAEILDLPYGNKRGLATKIVSAFQKAMTEALKRGETINVYGIGTFKVKTRPAKLHNFVYGNGGNLKFKTKGVSFLKAIPPRRYVHFLPSKSLRKPNETQP